MRMAAVMPAPPRRVPRAQPQPPPSEPATRHLDAIVSGSWFFVAGRMQVRGELPRLGQMGPRLSHVPRVPQRQGQLIVRLRVLGGEAHGFAELLDGSRVVPRPDLLLADADCKGRGLRRCNLLIQAFG